MQHAGINPVLPDAANPPCNAELATQICNENELVPVTERGTSIQNKLAVWPWLSFSVYPRYKIKKKKKKQLHSTTKMGINFDTCASFLKT